MTLSTTVRIGTTEFADPQAALDQLDLEFAGKGLLPGRNPAGWPGEWLDEVVKAAPAWRDALDDGLLERAQRLTHEDGYVILRLLGGGLQSPRLAGQLLDMIAEKRLPAELFAEAFALAAMCVTLGAPPGLLAQVQKLLPDHPEALAVWLSIEFVAALKHLPDALQRADPAGAQTLAVAVMANTEGLEILAQVAPKLPEPVRNVVGKVLQAALNTSLARDKALVRRIDKAWPDRPR